MASRSLPRLFFSQCIASNASNSTFPTGICFRSPSAFRAKPVSLPLPFWTLLELTDERPMDKVPTEKPTPLLPLGFAQPRIRRETFRNLHRSQSTYLAADDFRSIHRDRTGRGSLFLGPCSVRDRRLQRRPGRPVGPKVAPADFTGPISRSHRRQAFVEYHVSRPFNFAQDSLEIYCAGFQPRYFHTGRQCGAVCDRGPA